MTDREKKLLFLMLGALFVIGSFIAYSSFYQPAIIKAQAEKQAAETKLKNFQLRLQSQDSEELEREMQWLERSGTSVTTQAEAQSKLQATVSKSAVSNSLEVRDPRILPAQPGLHFDRVRVLFRVTGRENRVQNWINTIHRPSQRQVITKLSIKPQGNDLTRVEVEVEVERWIITERNLENDPDYNPAPPA